MRTQTRNLHLNQFQNQISQTVLKMQVLILEILAIKLDMLGIQWFVQDFTTVCPIMEDLYPLKKTVILG
jgi:hypothetical protein